MQVLIVYGSKRGGTAGLAHMIGTAFEREGWQADVRDAADAPGIGDVDVVVVGGGLYMNRWVKSVRGWAHHHRPTLRNVPVWFFSSGPLDASARTGDVAPVPSVAKLAREIEISGHQTFGGYLDAHPKGFFAAQMAKRNAGDWRDPEQVAEWVHDICHHMRALSEMPQQRPEPAPEPAPAVPPPTPATS
jgi:menaquinone-dependent protoporphyrinogen oxidase